MRPSAVLGGARHCSAVLGSHSGPSEWKSTWLQLGNYRRQTFRHRGATPLPPIAPTGIVNWFLVILKIYDWNWSSKRFSLCVFVFLCRIHLLEKCILTCNNSSEIINEQISMSCMIVSIRLLTSCILTFSIALHIKYLYNDFNNASLLETIFSILYLTYYTPLPPKKKTEKTHFS